VEGSVQRLETAYDSQGNPYLFTSFDAASGGTVVNQVQRTFNGLGQLTAEYQAHSGVVNTGTTPVVQYAYSEMAGGANHSRPTSLTYPNGRVINFNYASGLDDAISRLTSISDSSATLESYAYLGLDTVVKHAHPQPGIDLTSIKQSGESNGDAGDPYTGLDRFGRVVDQRWLTASTGTAVDRYQYGYDRDSNALYRDNLVNSAFGELYAYDGLNQLTSFQRGTLNGTKTGLTGSASHSQSWSFDALGNWSSLTTDGTAQTRSHNQQNEVTAAGAATLTFDAAGNTTTDDQGHTLVYDAWNRLVAVKSGATTLASYTYDALGRRASETSGGTTRDLYDSAAWQVLEERQSGQAVAQNVWSPVSVDALVERDRDTDANGTLDERLYVLQDANYNVTALVNTSGTVVERFVYDPYGQASVLNASWSATTDSYGWKYLHQGLRYDAAVGWSDSRFRAYSPTLGRFAQTDPIGFAGGDTNLYRAVGNAPPAYVDPTGLEGFWSGVGQGLLGVGETLGGIASVVMPIPNPGAALYYQDPRHLLPGYTGVRFISGVVGTVRADADGYQNRAGMGSGWSWTLAIFSNLPFASSGMSLSEMIFFQRSFRGHDYGRPLTGADVGSRIVGIVVDAVTLVLMVKGPKLLRACEEKPAAPRVNPGEGVPVPPEEPAPTGGTPAGGAPSTAVEPEPHLRWYHGTDERLRLISCGMDSVKTSLWQTILWKVQEQRGST
jgi:RHS repeat-associated protein